MPPVAAYDQIIEHIFFAHYKKGADRFDFARDELRKAAEHLKLKTPKNLGDVVYSYRYRRPLPPRVRETCDAKEEWVIRGVGHAKYRFLRVPITAIEPRDGLYQIKVPDATPEIVGRYALGDEQALLAKVRYNRLIDIFTGVAAYSLQNHLRTQVPEMGQIEIDELYVGISKSGAQFILPVQAKGGRDHIGRIQLEQDIV
ncbi:MAG: hypothetical protein JW940_32530, partial [Polyangiaceae bacterium]|nr:hypothetical protein [Polyangiaceae bacterium]